jgi:hypothetical protein
MDARKRAMLVAEDSQPWDATEYLRDELVMNADTYEEAQFLSRGHHGDRYVRESDHQAGWRRADALISRVFSRREMQARPRRIGPLAAPHRSGHAAFVAHRQYAKRKGDIAEPTGNGNPPPSQVRAEGAATGQA